MDIKFSNVDGFLIIELIGELDHHSAEEVRVKIDDRIDRDNIKKVILNFRNVTFKITDGYMEITPVVDEVVVTIAGNNASAVYDGTEHKVTGYTVVSISNKLYKESDFSFSGTAEAKRTEAGTTYMGLKEEHFKNKNK